MNLNNYKLPYEKKDKPNNKDSENSQYWHLAILDRSSNALFLLGRFMKMFKRGSHYKYVVIIPGLTVTCL